MRDDDIVQAKTDRAAFGRLYDRFYPDVLRYCSRRLIDRTVAEDVAADVFLSVASKMHGFPGRTTTDFRCWLFRIATNAVHAYLRQTKRRQALLEAAARSRVQSSATPTWEVLDWPAVYAAIMELDERQQAILTLRFFGGCAHDEIADTLEITADAVRTILSRALAGLREKLNPPSPTGEECASSKD